MSDSSRPHGLQLIRLLYPWDFPGKSTGVGCHCLLRFPASGDHQSILCINEFKVVSLFCFFSRYHILVRLYDICFSLYDISLGIISSKSIHVANVRISFFLQHNYVPLHTHTISSLSIHLSMDA